MKCQKVSKYHDYKKKKKNHCGLIQSISFIFKLCEISSFLPDKLQTLTEMHIKKKKSK